jgi:hypothetical protein
MTAQAQIERRKPVRSIDSFHFDYAAMAELFPARGRKARGPLSYKRFESAAEALRYAMEILPASTLLGTYLEVNESRFGHDDIEFLYNDAAYPLTRRAAA